MGEQKRERELFSYAVNLEERVRSDHSLRRVSAAIDFKFAEKEREKGVRHQILTATNFTPRGGRAA